MFVIVRFFSSLVHSKQEEMFSWKLKINFWTWEKPWGDKYNKNYYFCANLLLITILLGTLYLRSEYIIYVCGHKISTSHIVDSNFFLVLWAIVS